MLGIDTTNLAQLDESRRGDCRVGVQGFEVRVECLSSKVDAVWVVFGGVTYVVEGVGYDRGWSVRNLSRSSLVCKAMYSRYVSLWVFKNVSDRCTVKALMTPCSLQGLASIIPNDGILLGGTGVDEEELGVA